MGEPTNNVPPAWQQRVLDAIKEAERRRQELIANGTLKDDEKLAKEVFKEFVKAASASGVPAEEFPPEYHLQLGLAARKIVKWGLTLSKTYPATHRKGYGEAGQKVITAPKSLIFFWGGGGTGGPHPGPGGPEWPTPEDPPEDDWDFIEWVPEDEQDRARKMLASVKEEMDFGYGDEDLPFVREVARRLGGRWGLNGKRGNPNDPSHDILAYDFPGYQPQLFDVVIGGGQKNELGWNALAYPQTAGAVWLAP